ncbi:glycoside hydrolase family 3 protein [Catalinimonas niigatensis]|uniref:glycoside hydrolase family 3 protein n=1 Tax=Catalinimonas niigatensis TaxID=1397264 RepID=UPI00266657BD|nr:glycoside hydrolase family 3 N-terminal domain-containing protein [Catalinimonas niigatensis]WPP51171.1 glycoside hydrolase family 3 N-terminal domain-containing protein [Catalinimonas niigatensis]
MKEFNRVKAHGAFSIAMSIAVSSLLAACGVTSSGNESENLNEVNKQPFLGYRSAKILEIDGFRFKDLNKNAQLDPYEDWRLSYDERSKDLLSKMSLEQKAGFMLISSTRMENDWAFERPKNTDSITSGFNEDDLVTSTNMFTRKPLPYPNMSAAGTSKAVTQFHERHFILRANPSAKIIAEWANNLQALCESDGLGIPAIVASNPRNHITNDASIGLSVGKTDFSSWPGELGLAAMRDLSLSREFADIARQEWRSVGIRKGYMYMADLATEPRWQRVEGTFGEDAELAADMIRQIVLGFQGEELDSNSIALTTKHFPGGGATEGGQDPHFDWGKREVFPGGMFENNLIPFKAAIEAGTSAIMPYYSYPVGTKYEEVAYAYNNAVLQDLLRGELGFDGIINSDTGPIEMMPWGVEELSLTDRYKKAIEAGVNIFSGTADPTKLLETLKLYSELEPKVDASVYRLLMEKFALGLFENPYVDIAIAEEVVGKKSFQVRADLAMHKSIVLLRNEKNNTDKILPLQPKTKIYFESYLPKADASPSNVFIPESNSWEIEFVETPDKADVVLLWVIPKAKSLFESDGSPLYVSLSKNGVDVNYINQLSAKKPTILAINYTNPWVISEVFNSKTPNIKAVLATFGTTHDALLNIVTGKFNPSGKMPFSTPVSEDAAQNQQSDVPGYKEGSDYALFKFDEGLSFE